MTDLMEFLRTRLDEDEEVSRAAVRYWSGVRVESYSKAEEAHVARYDPARVLAEVAAKRAVLALHWIAVDQTNAVDGLATCNECVEYAPCDTLRILTSVYAGHPGYDWSWAVTS